MLASMILSGVVVPGVLSTATLVLARPWLAERRGWTRVVGALAVFLGLLGGSTLIVGVPELGPTEITSWIVHASALGLIASGLVIVLEPGRVAIYAGAALAVTYVILRPTLEHRWSGALAPLAVLAGAAGTLLYWLALDRIARWTHARLGATVLLVSMATTAAAAGASGTIVVARLAGAGTAALGGLWLVTMCFGRSGWLGSAVPVIATTAAASIMLATAYAAMTPLVAGAAVAVPLIAVATDRLAARLGLHRHATIGLVAALVAASAVLAMAGSTSAAGAAGYGY